MPEGKCAPFSVDRLNEFAKDGIIDENTELTVLDNPRTFKTKVIRLTFLTQIKQKGNELEKVALGLNVNYLNSEWEFKREHDQLKECLAKGKMTRTDYEAQANRLRDMFTEKLGLIPPI